MGFYPWPATMGACTKATATIFFPQKGYPEVEVSESKILGQTITLMDVPLWQMDTGRSGLRER